MMDKGELAITNNSYVADLSASVLLASDTGIIVIDSQAKIIIWNDWLTKYTQLTADEVVGRTLEDLFPDLVSGRLSKAIGAVLQRGMASLISHSLNKKTLPLFDCLQNFIEQQVVVKPVIYNATRYCMVQINDVTAMVSRERVLREQARNMRDLAAKVAREKEQAQVTLDSIADAVITTDSQGRVMSMNPVAELLTGHSESDALNRPVSQICILQNEVTGLSVSCPVMFCLQTLKVESNDVDHVLIAADGRSYAITDSVAPVLSSTGALLGAVLVFRNITESRSLAAELARQALHDPLTGLANRRAFEERMCALLEVARQHGTENYLLYLDLDQFKVVNDTCGHDAGDELLKQVAYLMQAHLRKTDLFARLGGDEFGVLLESCDSERAYLIANNLRQAIADFRFAWQINTFKIGLSIGIAKITGTEIKAAEVLSAADSACYVAKDAGRNRIHFHEIDASDSSMQQKEMQWITKIQAALDDDLFVLYAQRIQRITSDQASEHYEILVRMRGENGQLIPPDAFLPAAERFGLVVSLDRWVIQQAFMVLTKHLKEESPLDDVIFSINLSGATLTDESLLDYVVELFAETPVLPQSICFEITETAAIANLKQAIKFLTHIQNIGCQVALDDFGSGLSSFAYLKALPVNYLKIDGQFVKDISIDSVDRTFVEAINKIGHVMGLQTIAEYVEDAKILSILKEMRVDYAQGYGVHKPCPLSDIL
jgi:diguanylate cyclase (GGDEF)-like protein/PAS domain S-box-containing protein